MHSLTFYILSLSILLLACLVGTKFSSRFGLPSLLLYLAIGMIAGSEGLGRIAFDNVKIAQHIGIIGLILILFSGGLETQWDRFRQALPSGLSLATIGVIVTASSTAILVRYVLDFTWPQGFLLGTIVASTDAPAIFSLLRGKPNLMPDALRDTVEIESGLNDPMAVFLTTCVIAVMQNPDLSIGSLLPALGLQISVGACIGVLSGWLGSRLINRLRLEFDGLYPALTIALVFLTFGLADTLHGSGFLAVYACGVTLSRSRFFHRRSLIRFHDGIAWLMQIIMFLTLGLLVFPSEMLGEILPGIFTSLVLILLARPLSVLVSLLFSRFRLSDKMAISWAGLKGATPIVLATFPLLEGIHGANRIFNTVFFVVLVSTLIQGKLLSRVTKLLGVHRKGSLEESNEESPVDEQSELTELFIPYASVVSGKTVMDLELPGSAQVLLVSNAEGAFVPTGRTKLGGGDTILLLGNSAIRDHLIQRLQTTKPKKRVMILGPK